MREAFIGCREWIRRRCWTKSDWRRLNDRMSRGSRGGMAGQMAGKTVAQTSVTNNAHRPIARLSADTVRRPSLSVMPLILHMIQKPLSVIHEIGLLPAPIAIATYTG